MFRTSPAASLAWGEGSLCNQLAVGTRTGEVELWDAATGHLVRSMGGQDRRVATLAWCGNILSSGSKNGIVVHRDMRDPSRSIGEAHGHAEEICGLQWSPDQQQLASGGNEGLVCVWSMRSPKPEARIAEHEAAVKALAWSPHQRGLLATGGGTSDRCIRFWSSVHQATLDCVPAGSQVCNLAWGRYSNELVSTHGYNSHQVMLWKYPCMKQLAVLNGHTSRVLYLATAPDGQHIVTGAGDETLQFWNVFSGPRSGSSSSASAVTNRQPMPSLCRTIR